MFALINHTMAKTLRDTKQARKLASDLSYLAYSYVSSYHPTTADLKKLRVLKELRKNKNIVILNPYKGNCVVVLDRIDYDQGILKIINDTSKFRLLWKLKKNGHLDNGVYEIIYPKGSQPARICSLLKVHKDRGPNSTPPFCPIVSSIGTYNYNLAKYLCSLLTPHVPTDHCATDIKLSKPELRSLFTTAAAETDFLFNGSFYEQIDCVAMGSPLLPS